MLDYGWRQYMPELGRWNGMDQLSEMYSFASPYAYVGGNPIMMIDPDGRLTSAYGNIMPTEGGELPAGGFASYFAGGGSGFSSEMNAYFGTGNATMNFYQAMSAPSFTSNTISWWSGSVTQTNYRVGDEIHTDADFGILHSLTYSIENTAGIAAWQSFAKNWDSNSGISNFLSKTSFFANTAIGLGATANIPRTGVFKYNDLWHQTKTKGVSFAWQKKWKNPGARFWRGQQVKGLQGARSLGTKLTYAGGVLLAADIAMSGQVKPSHAINAFMLGISFSGFGSIVSGA